jgi:hypothetical protein
MPQERILFLESVRHEVSAVTKASPNNKRIAVRGRAAG